MLSVMSRVAPWPVDLSKNRTPANRGRADHVLQEIDRLVDWSEVEALLAVLPVNTAVRPRYPALLLLKVLLLQQWYDLSDPATEGAVNDRQSFANFVGLPAGAPSPSYSTINRFKAALSQRGVLERILDLVTAQLAKRGYAVRTGVMVDAKLSETARPWN